MAYINGNKPIVTDGLIYALDFGNHKSYTSGFTTANSLAYDQATTSVSGSPVLTDGILDFTSTKFVKRDGSLPALDPNGTFTVMIVGKSTAEGTLLHQDTLNATINSTSSLFGFGVDNGDFSRLYSGFTSSSLQHVTYRYSQGTVDTFINGIPATASAANSALTTTAVSNALFLGDTAGGFEGSVAQFYVYNRSLSADEIYQTYLVSAEKNGLPTIPKPYTQDENLYKYLQTTGITDATTISAVNTFISDLKSNGLWDKMTVIYPFLTTATGSQAVNLKDPGVLAVDYSGSYTASSTGPVPATATDYIDLTGIKPTYAYPGINSGSSHFTALSYDPQTQVGFLGGTSLPALGGEIIARSGSKVYHAFTTVGTSSFIPLTNAISNVEVMVVAGGGGGANGNFDYLGGGGAGGLVYSSSFAITPGVSVQVIVGNGGIAQTQGENSSFGSVEATGGGEGRAGNGGSGGGGTRRGDGTNPTGSGIDGQGNDGGLTTTFDSGGGGGGAGSDGGGTTAVSVGGIGGSGSYYTQFTELGGSPAGWFAGGGGGGARSGTGGRTGGIGGGGTGAGSSVVAATNGISNTGGGGGGGNLSFQTGGAGGSGIVIVGYDVSSITATTGSGTGLYITEDAITGSVNNGFTAGITGSGTIGFLTVSRTGSNSYSLRKNNQQAVINLAATASLTTDFFLGGANQGGLNLPLPARISYASVGAGLTDSEVSTYYNLVSQFQTNLKRQNTLLDNYSGAAAAYSLRRIGPSGYFGPAIRVRRDSDNALRDIGFTSDGQLDTVGLLDFVGVTGSGFVQTWYDQSGNGNDATQATAGSQPLLLSSGSIITRKQKPYFQSSPTQFLRLNSPIVAGIADYSWWITYEKSDNSGTAVLLQNGSNYHWLDYNTIQYLWEGIATQQSPGQTYLINTIKNYPTSLTFYRNSVSTGTTTPSATARSATEYIPSNSFRNTNTITLSEFIYYNSNQFTNKAALDSNINNYYKLYGDATASFDPDYQAFITATGITEPTQSAALETLVSDLKSYGLWDKMKAVYPMVTDKNNRFSRSEDFSTTWTKVSSSVTVDQITAPDGNLTADLILEEAGSGEHYFYETVNNMVSGNEYVLSIYGKFYNRPWIALQTNEGAQAWFNLQNGVTGSFTGSSVSITDVGSGWYRCALFFTGSTNGARNQHIHLADADGNYSYTGVADSGSYLWGAQFENGNLLGPYRKTEGSSFTTGSMLDQMKFNLVNPEDSDAAFRLTYSGSWNPGYGSNKPDGQTAWADTKLTPNTNLTLNNTHFSLYLQTPPKNLDYQGSEAGGRFMLIYNPNQIISDHYGSSGGRLEVSAISKGLIVTSRINSISHKLFLNRNLIGSKTTLSDSGLPSGRMYLGGGNINGGPPSYYSTSPLSFTTIGDGLTDYEAKALYWIVQKFQTTLGRQVY